MVQAINGESGWGSKVYVEQVRRPAERSEVQEQILEKVRQLSPILPQAVVDSGARDPSKGGLIDKFI